MRNRKGTTEQGQHSTPHRRKLRQMHYTQEQRPCAINLKKVVLIYVSKGQTHVYAYTKGKVEHIVNIHRTLDSLKRLEQEGNFFRIRDNMIINLRYFCSMDKHRVVEFSVSIPMKVFVSHRYVDDLKRFLKDWMF